MTKIMKWLFLTANGQAILILLIAFYICALLEKI